MHALLRIRKKINFDKYSLRGTVQITVHIWHLLLSRYTVNKYLLNFPQIFQWVLPCDFNTADQTLVRVFLLVNRISYNQIHTYKTLSQFKHIFLPVLKFQFDRDTCYMTVSCANLETSWWLIVHLKKHDRCYWFFDL